jgi:hypothetical protein
VSYPYIEPPLVMGLEEVLPGPQKWMRVGLAGAAVCALYCADVAEGIDLPCLNPFGCGSGSTTLTATDNNGNPLPEGATKLKGDQGFRLPDGTTYKPLRKGESGNHGETGHQIDRTGDYRNVKVSENGRIVPVEGPAGQWQRPR